MCKEKVKMAFFPRLLCVKGAVMRSMTEGLSARIRISPVPCENVTVKTRRRVADCARARKLRRRERTQKYVTETNAGEDAKCPLIPRFPQ